MARKRANGEGSYYQLKDRTWVYQVTVGRKEDGSPLRKSFKGRTKAICKERWEAWEAEQAELAKQATAERLEAENVEVLAARLGHFPEAETLFSDAFMEWLKLYKSPPTGQSQILCPPQYSGKLRRNNFHPRGNKMLPILPFPPTFLSLYCYIPKYPAISAIRLLWLTRKGHRLSQ